MTYVKQWLQALTRCLRSSIECIDQSPTRCEMGIGKRFFWWTFSFITSHTLTNSHIHITPHTHTHHPSHNHHLSHAACARASAVVLNFHKLVCLPQDARNTLSHEHCLPENGFYRCTPKTRSYIPYIVHTSAHSSFSCSCFYSRSSLWQALWPSDEGNTWTPEIILA